MPETVREQGDLPRFNVSNDTFSYPLGVIGRPLELLVFAPLSVCEEDEPRVDARFSLLGPDNFDVPGVTMSAPRIAPAGAEQGAPPVPVNAVSVTVSFTPTQYGQYFLRVMFEPSIGERSILLDVVEPRTDPPSVRVTVPSWSGCVDQPWALGADAVACERSTKNVEIFFADGGVTSFPGEQLVVAGPVLWSVVGATSQLERHKLVDGGVVLTDAFAGFSTRTVRGMHDERSALRSTNSGALMLAAIESPLINLGSQTNVVPTELLFVEGGELFIETPCEIDSCFGVRGLDPEVRWTVENLSMGIFGHRRPVSRSRIGPPDIVLERKVAPMRAPERGFERVPMWIPLPGTGLSALVNSDRPALGLSAWKPEDVIRVGRHFVLLRDQGDVLRVTPR